MRQRGNRQRDECFLEESLHFPRISRLVTSKGTIQLVEDLIVGCARQSFPFHAREISVLLSFSLSEETILPLLSLSACARRYEGSHSQNRRRVRQRLSTPHVRQQRTLKTCGKRKYSAEEHINQRTPWFILTLKIANDPRTKTRPPCTKFVGASVSYYDHGRAHARRAEGGGGNRSTESFRTTAAAPAMISKLRHRKPAAGLRTYNETGTLHQRMSGSFPQTKVVLRCVFARSIFHAPARATRDTSPRSDTHT